MGRRDNKHIICFKGLGIRALKWPFYHIHELDDNGWVIEKLSLNSVKFVCGN